MDLVSFYVMISRVTTSAGLRVLSKDKLGDKKIKHLRWLPMQDTDAVEIQEDTLL